MKVDQSTAAGVADPGQRRARGMLRQLLTRMRAPERLGQLAQLEPALYALVAGSVTLCVARKFYTSEFWQLNHAVAWALGDTFDPTNREALPKIWSAPLDDVFIHFDFARSAARGMPFQWIDGNGYSSGGTSLLYPLVLALGLLLGFRGLTLMHFAAIVATTSVFALLLGLRAAVARLPRATSYLLPFGVLSVGALDWSLFSGMEVAFFMAMWLTGFLAWNALVHAIEADSGARTDTPERFNQPINLANARASLIPAQLGLAAASWLIAATRPEAASAIAVLGLDAAFRVWRRRGARSAIVTLCAAGVPGALVLITQAAVNRWYTGDSAAAGAIVKLEMNNPLLTRAQVIDAYWFHLKYQVMRVTEYHFANNAWTGWLVWIAAAIALISPVTRRYAAVLWLSLIGWLLTVSLNGQVRWQNERYTMPAVAWLLIAASLGLASTFAYAWNTRQRWWARLGVPVLGAALAIVFAWGSRSTMRDQRWFFGRASRNIFDQHVQTGHLLRAGLRPQPHRVLVGDAGAITYVSDLPGLDIIGLGGTFRLPFARASQWGVGASVELIQHLPMHERPDTMAIYPGWWNDLPLWFGSELAARVPVRGNVICGGATKVVYRTDFTSLDDAERPLSVRPDERVADYLDFADLVSEREHQFELNQRAAGFVEMKKLAHPENPERDLWDAGRILSPGLVERFELRGIDPNHPAQLLFRVAPAGPAKFVIESGSRSLGEVQLEPSDVWVEVSLDVPSNVVTQDMPIALRAVEGGPTLYFLWVLQGATR
ncbi:MAG TPA: hypothetical protein VKP30_11985 [Polyangiaceae bacterium]|nr:hypothetical protein [Polyangiaceae bacterium]